MSLPTPEKCAREALGCLRAVVEPGRTAAGTAYCLRHDYPWLHDADTCPVAERVSVSIAARDEQVRADERARVSVVHSTLTDEQLVAELVRRGALNDEREHREVRMCGECWTHGFEYDTCDASCTYRPDEVRHERRVVGPWRTDTRTDEQRSDDAIATLRRRLGEGGTP